MWNVGSEMLNVGIRRCEDLRIRRLGDVKLEPARVNVLVMLDNYLRPGGCRTMNIE